MRAGARGRRPGRLRPALPQRLQLLDRLCRATASGRDGGPGPHAPRGRGPLGARRVGRLPLRAPGPAAGAPARHRLRLRAEGRRRHALRRVRSGRGRDDHPGGPAPGHPDLREGGRGRGCPQLAARLRRGRRQLAARRLDMRARPLLRHRHARGRLLALPLRHGRLPSSGPAARRLLELVPPLRRHRRGEDPARPGGSLGHPRRRGRRCQRVLLARGPRLPDRRRLRQGRRLGDARPRALSRGHGRDGGRDPRGRPRARALDGALRVRAGLAALLRAPGLAAARRLRPSCHERVALEWRLRARHARPRGQGARARVPPDGDGDLGLRSAQARLPLRGGAAAARRHEPRAADGGRAGPAARERARRHPLRPVRGPP